MKVYLDNGATTKVDPRVLKVMTPYFTKKYGNASSLHSFGKEAAKALEDSRSTIAKCLNAKPNEIIFTGSGTESNNLALKGVALANKKKGKHIIISAIEHHCILETADWLKDQGFSITFLPVDKYGIVELNELRKAIREDTIIVSIMFANNEIGTIQPIEDIGKICRQHKIYFHTDAVQAFGKVPIDVNKLNIDLLSISSHKIYGPKGVAALFIRQGVKIEPLLHGGGHEFGMRSSTENIPGIVGFAKASEIIVNDMKSETKRLAKFRDKLIKAISKIENSRLNGHPTKRLCNNVNFSFRFIEGEGLIYLLDDEGIAASTGSACSSKSLEPSHVLLAMGLKHEEAHGSLRITLGRFNKDSDINYLIKKLPKMIERLRKISPFKTRWVE